MLLAAVLLPSVATGIAATFLPEGTGIPVAVYLAAVVAAASIGGVKSGIGAALASSLAFIFFFTDPRYSLRIHDAEQVVTSVVFVIVAILVGTLFARAIEHGQRAARRERDARLLGYLSAKLLSGRSFQAVLDELAASLLDEMRLARCEIRAEIGGGELQAVAEGVGSGLGRVERIPVAVADRQLGWIEVDTGQEGLDLALAQSDLLVATATQVAVAMERTRLGDAVRDARVEAETSELRAALFSSVTHDLRTPLAAIKAGVTSLATEDAVLDPERRDELLATVTEETDRLDRLVGNILDLARARAGALVLERQKIGVDELIDALLTRLGPRLTGHQVETKVRPDVPDVWVDPVQLDQALTNVVENAIAYSSAGGMIRITVVHFRSMVEIRIADSGPGIPPEERERVFEAFSRGEEARSKPGSGLGLAIARAVVLSHGGSIKIEDAPGGGAAILIELPAWHEGVDV